MQDLAATEEGSAGFENTHAPTVSLYGSEGAPLDAQQEAPVAERAAAIATPKT